MNHQEPSLGAADGDAAIEPGTDLVLIDPEAPASRNGHKTAIEQDGFTAFWQAYPRKTAKAAARKAYTAALRKASAPILLEALRAALPELQNREPQFIPHASTWLNGERWLDQPAEPTAPRSRFIETTEGALALLRQTENEPQGGQP